MSRSFRSWLASQRARNDAVGDLARDVRDDLCGSRWRTWQGLVNHLALEHEYKPGQLLAVRQAALTWLDDSDMLARAST
jgi:hypothetical protein